jgi:glyoxylase-like metal-dependent hydrolase (beta-lactamase superfamily II)
MKRVTVLGLLLLTGVLSMAVSAYQQPAAGRGGQPQGPPVVEVEKLKDNLFVLKGGGGNTAVFVMTNGVAVVDAKNPGWGAPILAKIKELTPKPVTTLINTHTHGDHVSGNVDFPATVDVVVQENTKTNMEKMEIFKTNANRGMAKRTFKDRMTVGTGADQIELMYFGRAHTNGDAWIVIPSLRVVHAGDAFSGKNIPIIDANNGGSGVDYPETLLKAHGSIKNVDTIITGHSTQMTMNDLKEYSDFNRDFLNAVREAKKAGRTVDDVAGSWKVPAKYQGYAEPQAARLRTNVQNVYNEIP